MTFRTSLGAFVAFLGIGCALGCSNGGGTGCTVVCPVGCLISADCASCTPAGADAGLGTACRNDADCCTGHCGAARVCIAGSIAEGTSGGTTGSSSTGGASGCHGWTSAPSFAEDAACNPAGGTSLVCSSAGSCIGNCNGQPVDYCAAVAVCAANGHCEQRTNGGTTGSSGGATGGNGGSAGGSTGGTGGRCGQTGVASCTDDSAAWDCCSQYCVSGTCHCNVGGDQYPCLTDDDCCGDSSGCGADGKCQ
jgi:hypothetical protein